MANVGVRGGVIWRGTRQAYATGNSSVNLNRPFNGFNVPVMIPDPGQDGRIHVGRRRGDSRLQPGAGVRRDTVDQRDEERAKLRWGLSHLRIQRNKRMSNRWSLAASFSVMKSWFNGAAIPEAQSPNTIRTNQPRGTE